LLPVHRIAPFREENGLSVHFALVAMKNCSRFPIIRDKKGAAPLGACPLDFIFIKKYK
jgi:hypothetical protein